MLVAFAATAACLFIDYLPPPCVAGWTSALHAGIAIVAPDAAFAAVEAAAAPPALGQQRW